MKQSEAGVTALVVAAVKGGGVKPREGSTLPFYPFRNE
jgi:hypothetical protein